MENTSNNQTQIYKNKKHTICSESGARMILIRSNADQIIQELFDLLLNRYKTTLDQ